MFPFCYNLPTQGPHQCIVKYIIHALLLFSDHGSNSSMVECVIHGNMSLCFQVMVTCIWLRTYYLLLPLEHSLCFGLAN